MCGIEKSRTVKAVVDSAGAANTGPLGQIAEYPRSSGNNEDLPSATGEKVKYDGLANASPRSLGVNVTLQSDLTLSGVKRLAMSARKHNGKAPGGGR